MSAKILKGLNEDEIKRGIHYVLNNAEEMIAESDLLYQNKSYARAYTLCQLASEEVGKSHVLFRLLLDLKAGTPDYDDLYDQFMGHKAKSKSAIDFEKLALLLMHSNQDGEPESRKQNFFSDIDVLDREIKNVSEVNDNKNNSLYVGIKGDKFISPKDFITAEMADGLKRNALMRLNAAQGFLTTLIDDIDTIAKGIQEFQDSGEKIDETFLMPFFKK